jgi:hypothetical protein
MNLLKKGNKTLEKKLKKKIFYNKYNFFNVIKEYNNSYIYLDRFLLSIFVYNLSDI